MDGALAARGERGKAEAPRRAIIVAGPTCSGKSQLAMTLAERLGGVVINADSMQVYQELRIVTARPSPEDEARVPHALYGVRPAREAGSVAWWRVEALLAMEDARMTGRVPIICGGTGLYLRALTSGLAGIPPAGQAAREEARGLLTELGPEALHQRLAERDPATAYRLRPQDSQRIARAWEVLAGTGRGLASWQEEGAEPEAGWSFRAVLLDPPREELRAAIRLRFSAMLQAGAVEEVAALLALRLDPDLPAMRAHGVPELRRHIEEGAALAVCVESACVATGQYTKRQATWFRHQALAPDSKIWNIPSRWMENTQLPERSVAELRHFMAGSG